MNDSPEELLLSLSPGSTLLVLLRTLYRPIPGLPLSLFVGTA